MLPERRPLRHFYSFSLSIHAHCGLIAFLFWDDELLGNKAPDGFPVDPTPGGLIPGQNEPGTTGPAVGQTRTRSLSSTHLEKIVNPQRKRMLFSTVNIKSRHQHTLGRIWQLLTVLVCYKLVTLQAVTSM